MFLVQVVQSWELGMEGWRNKKRRLVSRNVVVLGARAVVVLERSRRAVTLLVPTSVNRYWLSTLCVWDVAESTSATVPVLEELESSVAQYFPLSSRAQMACLTGNKE